MKLHEGNKNDSTVQNNRVSYLERGYREINQT